MDPETGKGLAFLAILAGVCIAAVINKAANNPRTRHPKKCPYCKKSFVKKEGEQWAEAFYTPAWNGRPFNQWRCSACKETFIH